MPEKKEEEWREKMNKFNLNQKVFTAIEGVVDGFPVEQLVEVYVMRISIGATSVGVSYNYGLSKHAACAYGTVVEIMQRTESEIHKERPRT